MEKIRLLSLPFLVSFFILFYLIPFYFLSFFLYLKFRQKFKSQYIPPYIVCQHEQQLSVWCLQNRNAVCCNKFEMWVPIVCKNLSKYCYRELQKDNSPWFCVDFLKKEMPFSSLYDNQLKMFMSQKTIISPKNLVLQSKTICIPLKNSMMLKFVKNLTIYSYI